MDCIISFWCYKGY